MLNRFLGFSSTAEGETCYKTHEPWCGSVTSLATKSSLMRMKSIRRSAAMPNALWMLFRSSAMSGSVDDSFKRWLRRKHTNTHHDTSHWHLFDIVEVPDLDHIKYTNFGGTSWYENIKTQHTRLRC